MVSRIWKGPTWTIQLLLICSYLVKLVRYLSTIKTWRSFPLDQSCTWKDLLLKNLSCYESTFWDNLCITFWVAVFYFWKGYLPSHFPPCFETCLIIYGQIWKLWHCEHVALQPLTLVQAVYQAVHHMSYTKNSSPNVTSHDTGWEYIVTPARRKVARNADINLILDACWFLGDFHSEL